MDLNRSTVRQIMRLIAFTLILYWALQNYAYLGGFINASLRIIRPFIFGGIIAFILNVPMRAIERLLLPETDRPQSKFIRKIRRPVGLILTLLLFFGVIALILTLVIPELINSVTLLAQNLPGFLDSLQKWVQGRLSGYPQIANIVGAYTLDWSAIGSAAVNWLQNSAGGVLTSTASWISLFITSLYSTFFSMIIAIFILAKKETLTRQFRHVMTAYLPEVWTNRILSLTNLFSRTFSSFISGQMTEASIMGVLFMVAMLIFGMPYAPLISVLAAVSDMVPVIGPFIGCVVGVFLIMVNNPVQALWFLILFLSLQQIEQNLIYPRVVGTSVGLPGLWVLVAVMVGGSLYGVLGIFLSIPIFSVFYTLIQESVRKRLQAQREANATRSEAEAMESDDI